MANRLKTLVDTFDLRYLNAASTIRSSLGFTRSLFGLNSPSSALENIFNYLPLSDQLASSGQPTAAQFPAIAAAGFRRIINLAPHHAENAIENEREIVEGLGMAYVHLPVDFKNPTEQDFEHFCTAMAGGDRIFVHCAANMRVSAFLYRYRTQILGEAPETARVDLEKIWKPFGIWADFLKH